MADDKTAVKADDPVVDPIDEATTQQVPSEAEQIIENSDVEGDLVENLNPLEEELPEEVETPEEVDSETPETEEAPADEPEKVVAEPEEEIEAPTPPPPDPGDFKAQGDYSFEVTTTDGKTLKISSIEEADAFASKLDENPELITVSQLTKFYDGRMDMRGGLRDEQKAFDDQQKDFQDYKTFQETQAKEIVQLNNEFNYLTKKGDIPAVKPEHNTAEAGKLWATSLRNEPGVKERMDIIEQMSAEEREFTQENLPYNKNAINTYRSMQGDNNAQKDREEKTTERENRQKRGSMVGSNAAFTPTTSSKGSIIGEGGSLTDLVSEYYQ